MEQGFAGEKEIRKTTARTVKELGLNSRIIDVLNQQFTAHAPDQVWMADINLRSNVER
ncbi:hypothetical protein [Brevibacillus agri]|uniref:hypothetical protein n=1 Tax=Brevibacillus agri TaxID=51101 RepID=UPI0024BFB959|nr:hypothetical protein [Brevibacillus agri]MED4572071.1 hypothetical protein [Brevibacillus agri]WHX32510.1 hypothetical protein QNK09_10025 [Brevibacillus agri]